MTLWAWVEKGRFRLSNLREQKLLASFGPKDGEKLARFVLNLVVNGQWTGRVLSSSSMDWAKDDGWPEATAWPFVEKAMKRMQELAEAEGAKKRKQKRKQKRRKR